MPKAIRTALRLPVVIDSGLTVTGLSVRLTLDKRRSGATAELDASDHAGLLAQRRVRLLQGLLDGDEAYLMLHLAQHPDDTGTVLQMIAAARERTDQVRLGLLDKMIDNGFILDADIGPLRDSILGTRPSPALPPASATMPPVPPVISAPPVTHAPRRSGPTAPTGSVPYAVGPDARSSSGPTPSGTADPQHRHPSATLGGADDGHDRGRGFGQRHRLASDQPRQAGRRRVTAPRGSGTDDRGAAWRKPAFLLLAVIPVALVVPIVAARPWLGLPVLTLGMLAGLGFMTVGGEPDDRTVEAPLPEEPVEASLEPVEQVPAWAPSRGPDPFGRNPDRVAAEHPAAPHRPYPFDDHRRHDRSSGPPLGTLPPRQALAPPHASVDPGAADPGAADRVADAPPVLDGGTVAGRSPWRLPDVQGHPGIAADAAQVGDLEVRAASIIGPSHRCESSRVAPAGRLRAGARPFTVASDRRRRRRGVQQSPLRPRRPGRGQRRGPGLAHCVQSDPELRGSARRACSRRSPGRWSVRHGPAASTIPHLQPARGGRHPAGQARTVGVGCGPLRLVTCRCGCSVRMDGAGIRASRSRASTATPSVGPALRRGPGRREVIDVPSAMSSR